MVETSKSRDPVHEEGIQFTILAIALMMDYSCMMLIELLERSLMPINPEYGNRQ